MSHGLFSPSNPSPLIFSRTSILRFSECRSFSTRLLEPTLGPVSLISRSSSWTSFLILFGLIRSLNRANGCLVGLHPRSFHSNASSADARLDFLFPFLFASTNLQPKNFDKGASSEPGFLLFSLCFGLDCPLASDKHGALRTRLAPCARA